MTVIHNPSPIAVTIAFGFNNAKVSSGKVASLLLIILDRSTEKIVYVEKTIASFLRGNFLLEIIAYILLWSIASPITALNTNFIVMMNTAFRMLYLIVMMNTTIAGICLRCIHEGSLSRLSSKCPKLIKQHLLHLLLFK